MLVTLDTTRADAIGAWGGPPTPTLDRLAAAGTRFAHALTPSPLTLPAHASLLTGREPLDHGLRHNSGGRLAPELPTLAEAVRRRGWTTAAFVASLVLDRRSGLDRGFDLYDDRLLADRAGQYGIPERDAASLTDLALRWLAARRPDESFLLWVHFFDPHAPYDAPGATDRERYLGEIANVDRELGRLLAALPADALVAVVGDHGESLGERGERFHGLALHSPTLHVPLLLEGPGVPVGRLVASTVSTARVAATILALAGLADDRFGPPLPGLAPAAAAEAAEVPVLSETLLPLDLYGWAPLAAVTSGRLRYVGAPRPQLYDLADDPGETHDLAGERPAAAARLAAIVEGRWRPPAVAADPGVVDAATQSALEALGYAAAAGAAGDGTDPVAGLELLRQLEASDRLLATGQAAAAAAVLDAVLRRNPSNPAAWARLAVARTAIGEVELAVAAARRAASLRPGSVLLAMRLADTLRASGRPEGAAAAYQGVVELDPRWAPAWAALADLAAERGDAAGERAILRRAVVADSLELLTRLARREAAQDPPADPVPWLERAAALDPSAPRPWLVRGDLALAAGRPGDALSAYTRASELAPASPEAALGIGEALLAAGDPVGARPHLRRAAVLGRGTAVEPAAEAALAHATE